MPVSTSLPWRACSRAGATACPARRTKATCRRWTSLANAPAMLAGSLEEMILAQAAALADTVSRVAQGILKVRSRLRPGRSYPGKSMKPASKWNRRGKAAA